MTMQRAILRNERASYAAIASALVLFAPSAWTFISTARAQDTTSPASQQAPDQQRRSDLIALIEGPNSPATRRTGARELLRLDGPEANAYTLGILRGQDVAAQTAIALALSDLPQSVTEEYAEPLLALLGHADAGLRSAAAAALASCPSESLIAELRRLALSNEAAIPARQAAIEALGLIGERAAVAALIEALGCKPDDSLIGLAALDALERATGKQFGEDTAAALRWWSEVRETPPAKWQRLRVSRLASQNRMKDRRLRELEQRLVGALRENYDRLPEAQRPALLVSFLNDPLAPVRCLGLELVQSQLAEGKTLGPGITDRARDLLAAQEPSVRAAAVRTVATLRDPADADRFRELLERERRHEVRSALINGLGYVGTGSALAPLLAILQSQDHTTWNEAATALGRLSERGVLDEQMRARGASVLLACAANVANYTHQTRERLLWAMSRIGDPRFGAVFVAALDTPESAAVRLAAARGIAVLVNPRTIKPNGTNGKPTGGLPDPDGGPEPLTPRALLDALLPATRDSDPVVRRVAVEILAEFGTTDEHAEALWARLPTENEEEGETRVTAWRGAIRIIASRPLTAVKSWLERLPGDEESRRRQSVELLQAVAQALAGRPEAIGDLAWVQGQLARLHAAMGQVDAAVAAYLASLETVTSDASIDAGPFELELLRFALLHNRYGPEIAAAIQAAGAQFDYASLWKDIAAEAQQRLNAGNVDGANALLLALQLNPPAPLPDDIATALQAMLDRSHEAQATADATRIHEALQKLFEQPTNEQLRQTILSFGERGVPAIRDALREALLAEEPDAARVSVLHDLLKGVAPQWPGFGVDDSVEKKLGSLDQLSDI